MPHAYHGGGDGVNAWRHWYGVCAVGAATVDGRARRCYTGRACADVVSAVVLTEGSTGAANPGRPLAYSVPERNA